MTNSTSQTSTNQTNIAVPLVTTGVSSVAVVIAVVTTIAYVKDKVNRD